MPCCLAHTVIKTATAHGALLGRPPCAPTLQTASLPAALLTSPVSGLRPAMTSAMLPPAPWAGDASALLNTVPRPRPPPGALPPLADRLVSPGLRAPPTA